MQCLACEKAMEKKSWHKCSMCQSPLHAPLVCTASKDKRTVVSDDGVYTCYACGGKAAAKSLSGGEPRTTESKQRNRNKGGTARTLQEDRKKVHQLVKLYNALPLAQRAGRQGLQAGHTVADSLVLNQYPLQVAQSQWQWRGETTSKKNQLYSIGLALRATGEIKPPWNAAVFGRLVMGGETHAFTERIKIIHGEELCPAGASQGTLLYNIL